MNGVAIDIRNGGIGRRTPTNDGICGLIASGAAVVGGVQLNEVYKLESLDDAVALGIDSDYDTGEILVYEHVKEFFRIYPSGVLYILVVAQTETFANMVDSTIATNALKLMTESKGDIRQLGVVYNPAVAVADQTALLAAVAKAQEFATAQAAAFRPIIVVLEGKGYDPDAGISGRTLNAKNVSVVVGQSMSIAADHPTYAAVGTILGAIARSRVNASIAWVQNNNLLGGTLQEAAVAGANISTYLDGDISDMDADGVIMFVSHVGFSGLYPNDSHACVELTSDFAYIEDNRVINKASRLVRAALLPRVASPQLIDSETGQLELQVVKDFESVGTRALEELLKNEECSSIDVYVDPAQNILTTSELKVEFDIVPTGTARKIKGSIGFTNPF